MEKMLGSITNVLMLVAVIILIIWYYQMIKNTKKQAERDKERDEQEKEFSRVMHESNIDINKKIISGEIKLSVKTPCGCKEEKKSTVKKTTNKKKANAKV